MTRRAYGSEDKEARRESILKAASGLFLKGHGNLPSAANIAATTGLAKGTIYLYFQTKEEIFAAILFEGWGAVMNEVDVVFRATKGGNSGKIAAFIEVYVRHFAKRVDLLRLDALGYGILERNLKPLKLRAFKMTFFDRLTRSGAIVDDALGLTPGRGIALLLRSYAMTRGLWQSGYHSHSAASRKLKIEYKIIKADFEAELSEALTEYWHGALRIGKY
jgi:AcrR family transcriptional regulator